ncbi:hypothetical protein N7535_005921 [Penicillium sp. DV-2018c]|nr:hypothetical protein N7461_009500 [Penicillium sp. DV-2018c]KAJ5572261.1 hypothetical protein N7535_005921 [Penicillium sp. DV-2018c]
MSQAPGSTGSNDLTAESSKRQPRKKPTGLKRRVPLQQLTLPSQPNVAQVDVPGSGPGKENIPPGWIVEPGKDDDHAMPRPGPQHPRHASQRATSAGRATVKPDKAQKRPLARAALGETHGNIIRLPKRPATETTGPHPDAVALRRALRAVIIQRAWRAYVKRRDSDKQWACDVIARWWLRVKATKLPVQNKDIDQIEQTEQFNQSTHPNNAKGGQAKQTQQKPRQKSAGQRRATRQVDGLRRIRRL